MQIQLRIIKHQLKKNLQSKLKDERLRGKESNQELEREIKTKPQDSL